MVTADLARTLREVRTGLGITQGQAAERTGIRRPAISDIEHGKRNVLAGELAAFAAAYGTTADALLAGTQGPGSGRKEAAMPPEDETDAGPLPEGGRWLELELLGHRQRTGYVTEVTVAGAAMLHIDLPAKLFGGDPDAWEEYAPSALYGLSPVREDSVRRAWESQLRAAEERARREAEWQQNRALTAGEVRDSEGLDGEPDYDGDGAAWVDEADAAIDAEGGDPF